MSDLPAIGDVLPTVIEALAGHGAERWPVVRTGERAPIPRVVRLLVWRRDEGRCQLCSATDVSTELDHITPWSAGGSDDSTNLRVLCGPCNQDRSNYRTMPTAPMLPVVMCCDQCLRILHHHNPGRRCRYWPLCPVCGSPAAETVEAYCGTCRDHDAVADVRRLL